MKKKIPFPRELLHQTPATIRVAFDSARNRAGLVETGRVGEINITSVLSKIIQAVGRFTEHWNSDALYTLDNVRTLCENDFDLEGTVDEIFVFGIRKSGVDHNAFVMSQLFQSQRGVGTYAYVEPYYRKLLAVNVKITPREYAGDRPHVTCELRDITANIHRIDPADFGENDQLKLPPYKDGNPVPANPAPEPDAELSREHFIIDKEAVKLLRVRTPETVDDATFVERFEAVRKELENDEPTAEHVTRVVCERHKYTWSYVDPDIIT